MIRTKLSICCWVTDFGFYSTQASSQGPVEIARMWPPANFRRLNVALKHRLLLYSSMDDDIFQARSMRFQSSEGADFVHTPEFPKSSNRPTVVKKVNQANLFLLTEVEFDPGSIAEVFERLEFDPYCEGGYRKRALNRYWVENDRLVPQPHEPFYQQGSVNKLWGDIFRNFPEVDYSKAEFAAIEPIALKFLSCCECEPQTIVLQIHPIRTLCSPSLTGLPAPEGIHSDGYLFTSIFCAARSPSIEGGRTFLYVQPSEDNPVFERQLAPGELLVINDEKLFHDTTAVHTEAKEFCARDVIVFTLSPRGCDPRASYSR